MADGNGLMAQWGLAEANEGSGEPQARKLREDFCQEMSQVDAALGKLVQVGGDADCAALQERRDKAFQAYQKVQKGFDNGAPKDGDKQADQVMSYVADLKTRAEDAASGGEAAQGAWEAGAAEREELAETIDGLDLQGHEEAGDLLDQMASLEELAAERRWTEALEAQGELAKAVAPLASEAVAARPVAARTGPDEDDGDSSLSASTAASVATAAVVGAVAGPAAGVVAGVVAGAVVDAVAGEEAAVPDEREEDYKTVLAALTPEYDKMLALNPLPVPLTRERNNLKTKHTAMTTAAGASDWDKAIELADELVDSVETFHDDHAVWLKARKDYEKKEPALRPKITEAIAVVGFNRELQVEQDIIKAINSQMVTLAAALDFKAAHIMIEDMKPRIAHFLKRDAHFKQEREVREARDKLQPRLDACLAPPELPALADQRRALVEAEDKASTEILGENFKKAEKAIAALEKAIAAYETAKAEFDSVIAEATSRLDGAKPGETASVAREVMAQLSDLELASLPKALRERLRDAVKEAEDAGNDKQTDPDVGRIDATEPPEVPAVPAYQADLEAAKKQLEDYGKIPKEKRAFIKEPTDAMAKHLADAEKKAKAGEAEGVEAALAKFAEEVEEAVAILELRSGYPSEENLVALLDNPGGAEVLDEMVKGLPDDTAQQAFKVAIEARFGKTIEVMDDEYDFEEMYSGADKSMKKLYELMEMVPESHIADNDRLDKIVRNAEVDDYGGVYDPNNDEVVLGCGKEDDGATETMGLDEADDDCKPDPDADPVSVFSFTALHEIGHAVDEKRGFMKANGSNAAYGGWTEYAHGDVTEVAKACIKKTGYKDTVYVEAYLTNPETKQAPAAKPADKTDDEWAALRSDAEDWCDGVREAADLWYNPGQVAGLAVDGKVYQEAYGGWWVSYALAARSKGFTPYQFRHPAEWFAELYAAYYAKQLPATHPALSWLVGLDAP